MHLPTQAKENANIRDMMSNDDGSEEQNVGVRNRLQSWVTIIKAKKKFKKIQIWLLFIHITKTNVSFGHIYCLPFLCRVFSVHIKLCKCDKRNLSINGIINLLVYCRCTSKRSEFSGWLISDRVLDQEGPVTKRCELKGQSELQK